MNEKFYELSKDKQDTMINGALKIFAREGYQRASTDVIVKEAGISKGLLFHYFGNKKTLYCFVLEYSARYQMMEIGRDIKEREKNLFNRVRLTEGNKMRMLKRYPYLDLFLISASKEIDSEVEEEARKWSQAANDVCMELWKMADAALLRGNLTIDEAIDITMLCMEGYKNRMYNLCGDPEEVLDGFLPYLEILKRNFIR